MPIIDGVEYDRSVLNSRKGRLSFVNQHVFVFFKNGDGVDHLTDIVDRVHGKTFCFDSGLNLHVNKILYMVDARIYSFKEHVKNSKICRVASEYYSKKMEQNFLEFCLENKRGMM